MRVAKYSGQLVPFEPDKLESSLRKSGANPEEVKGVMKLIRNELYEGIPTKRIYKLAFQYLKRISKAHAARYNLRTALLDLGPAGFFFEKFIARLLEIRGYQTHLNVILDGRCVSHEIDILAKRSNKVAMIECKFHGGDDSKTDVKVPMYILSRFNDLKDTQIDCFGEREVIEQCYIVTNNRFTQDAVQFAQCSGLELISWDYPESLSIKESIDTFCMYPVTCLTTLTRVEKEKLLIQDIITIRDLYDRPESLGKIGISHTRMKNILKEVDQLYETKIV